MFQPEESEMSKQNKVAAVREVFEKACTAIASTAIIVFMAAGAYAMCAPGILAA
jgi:hypothetical protein